MRNRQFLKNLLTLAVLGAGAYGVMKWQRSEPQENEITKFAEKACVDEAENRYDVSNVRPYRLSKNSNGYVVRVSATLARGTPVKIICLTNEHGGITNVSIDEL